MAFLFFALGVSAQNVTINIKAVNVGERPVRLFVSEDCFSALEKKHADTALDVSQKEFSFALTLDGVSIASLRVDAFEFRFIVQPGKIYNVEIDSINYALTDSINALANRCVLPARITNLEEGDLNLRIADFDAALEDYIVANDKALLVQRDTAAVRGLDRIVKGFLSEGDSSSYFASYVRYEYGKLRYILRLDSRKRLRAELFANKPILYYNIGYADCFNHVFGHYFSRGNRYLSQDELEFWLSTNNYDDLTDALGKDAVLKNEVLRELVLIKGMRDAYIDGNYERSDIIKMLERVETGSKFPEHRTIARNTIEFLVGNSYSGLKTREFDVLDLAGEKQVLHQDKTKPTVMIFVKLNDNESKRELEVVNYLYENVKERCEVVSVCCDRNLDAMYNFLKNSKVGSKYKWKFVYFDQNFDMLEHYGVRAFPWLVLVSPEGKVIENPMRNPSEGSLSRFLSKQKGEQ